MKLKFKDNFMPYSHLNIGDFCISNGMLYLKLSSSHQSPNAFNCTEEKLADIDKTVLVKPINIELREV